MLCPLILSSRNLVSEAASGTWKHNSVGWWYEYPDGTYVKSAWLKDGGKWYCFDAKGYMMTGWWQIGGKYYYFGTDGAMKTGWVKVGGNWFFLGKDGVMKTGWLKDGGNWYYFGKGGAMYRSAWLKDSGKWYFFKANGAMLKESWLKDGGKTYYFGADGAMVTGWKTISGKQYYFGTDGARRTGKVTISGKQYYFDENGVLDQDRTTLLRAKVGSVVTLGAYEQDNVKENGAEKIEWIVLDKKDSSLLLLSKYALDNTPFNDTIVETAWEDCTLRKKLNGEFLQGAFTEKESKLIVTTTISRDVNEKYGTTTKKAVKDKIFLLSADEAKKYFADDDDHDGQYYGTSLARACRPTEYAKKKGVYTLKYATSQFPETYEKFDGCCYWWLRTPGKTLKYSVNVSHRGDIYYEGNQINYIDHAVRPAMWINP